MRKVILGLVSVFVMTFLVGCVPQSDLPVVDDTEETTNNPADTNADETDTNGNADEDSADENEAEDGDMEEVNEDEMQDGEGEEGDDSGADAEVRNGQYSFVSDDTEVSREAWKVVGGHEGVVDLQEGTAEYEDGKLIGGTAVIDMTTIRSTDNGGNEGLDNHLKNEDFFAVDTYPTATLEIVSVEYTDETTANVTANLTIRGITNTQEFVLTETANGFTAELMIDRIAYDVIYNSSGFFKNLGDKAIKDEFALRVDATFAAN